jgi:hypothetical protein
MTVKTKFGKAEWVGDGNREHNLHLTLVPDADKRSNRRAQGLPGHVTLPMMCGRGYVVNTTWAKALKAQGKKCGNCQRFVPGHEANGPWAIRTTVKPR